MNQQAGKSMPRRFEMKRLSEGSPRLVASQLTADDPHVSSSVDHLTTPPTCTH